MYEQSMMGTAAAAAIGMAVGAVAVYAATQDRRQLRRTVHGVARGAEKALADLDHMVEHYIR